MGKEVRLIVRNNSEINPKWLSLGTYNLATEFNKRRLERARRQYRLAGYSTKTVEVGD